MGNAQTIPEPMPPPVVPIELSDAEMVYARRVAMARHNTGTKSRTPHSGFEPIRVDLLGTMGEMAVCKAYGLDYEMFVTVYSQRPGAIADLTYGGYRASVKASSYFGDDPHMVVPEYDTENDIYIAVGVNIERAYCELRGFVTKNELMDYTPLTWRWTTDRPGADSPAKRRYVPAGYLHQCRPR